MSRIICENSVRSALHLLPGKEIAGTAYLDPIVIDLERDPQSPLASLRPGHVGRELVDGDLEVLDLVEREAQSRREPGGDETHHAR